MPADESAAYRDLLDHQRRTALLGSAAGLLGWDQEVLMPPGAVSHRAAQLAELARVTHARATDPAVGRWLDICKAEGVGADDPASAEAVNLREWRRGYDRATRLPSALAVETAALQSTAQAAWAQARHANDFAGFAEPLARTVELARRKADALNPDGRFAEPWDALAESYEPGLRAAEVERVFAALIPPLKEVTEALIDAQAARGEPADLRRHVPRTVQEPFFRDVLRAVGFNFDRGRLDSSAHPFCSGSHPTDVRLTTHYDEHDIIDGLSSALHEAGHGMYEQGLPAAHAYTPRGGSIGLAIHESQSRLWENHVGRSPAFWRWALPKLNAATGDAFDGLDPATLCDAINRVAPGLIRIEADEATYHQHIAIRFDLERRMLDGRLATADLPDAWRAAYADRLGVAVPDDARGCLQDIHWSMGALGYFPTYTLGSLYAAQLFDAAERDLGPQADAFAAGDFTPLRRWLNTHIHEPGHTWDAETLCTRVTGNPLDPTHFLNHLRSRI